MIQNIGYFIMISMIEFFYSHTLFRRDIPSIDIVDINGSNDIEEFSRSIYQKGSSNILYKDNSILVGRM